MYRWLVIIFTIWATWTCFGLISQVYYAQSNGEALAVMTNVIILLALTVVFWLCEIVRVLSEFFNRIRIVYDEELNSMANSEGGTEA
jgi:hypothetical protein